MTDEIKVTTETRDASSAPQEETSAFSFEKIYSMVILNWQWFLLSLFICLCAVALYLRYATPTYQVSAKMLVKDDDKKGRGASDLMANMADFGMMTTSAGIDNEVEIIKSSLLARQAVKNLKLYVEYQVVGKVTNHLVYHSQPFNVDLDPNSLNLLDADLLTEVRSIRVTMTRVPKGYDTKVTLISGGNEVAESQCLLPSLPASLETRYGTLTFTHNAVSRGGRVVAQSFPMGSSYIATIRPPMIVARSYAKSLTAAPSSKQTTIMDLTLTNQNTQRALDYVNELVRCYNAQANADKNEIALKTEEFINGRLEKINAELGSTEGALESFKKRNAVVQIDMDATQSITQSAQYEAKLTEVGSQIQLLDYLSEFVNTPSNAYKIIPSNVGMQDPVSAALIATYNQTVQDRNRLLRAASEQAPQVKTLTSTLDDLLTSIRTALEQARRSAEIHRQSLRGQYAKYQGRIGDAPEQERILTQIGRQQEVKSGLYLLLLQKREENSISLAATADKGRLIDEPQAGGKISPKSTILLLIAIILGLGIPIALLFLNMFLRFRIEGHDDVAQLTDLPIVADVPVASDSVKTAAGIVVQANKNNQIDEIFRSMRTNIQFMMKEHEKVILFTSSTSGEGKTFLASNLAVSFALLGKKVILCGLDIRKPALGRLFGLKDRTIGVTQLLKQDSFSESDLNSCICPSGVNENLDLLMAGPTPPNPTELLARENLHQVIEMLKQRYDYVILDTAPVGLVTDTLLISRYAAVNCYVCRADYTPKSNFGMVNSLSREGKFHNVAIILNGVDMSKKKYGYYYGYGKYGKYGRYGYGRYGYGRYGKYGYGNYGYGNYGSYGQYADSRYSNKDDDSIKK